MSRLAKARSAGRGRSAARQRPQLRSHRLTGTADPEEPPPSWQINSWAFGQLCAFIEYKARRAGVPVVYVNPAHTSQECSRCHHIAKRNRPHQAVFMCRSCGFVEHADLNASHVIGRRGWYTWVCGAESQVPALALIA